MNKYQETTELLKNYNSLKANIDNMKSELEELKEISISGIDYSKDKLCQTFKFSSSTEDLANRTIILEMKIKATERQIERIDRALESVSEIEKAVIVLYYFEGLPWYRVAYHLSYSERQCKRKRNDAVNKISIALYGK